MIDVQGVSLERDFTQILNDVSWQVRAGEHWVVFGPNGAGKTTLLNVVQGYLWPTAGSVGVFGGQLGDGVDVRELRKNMPVVSEAVRNMINTGLTGLEVLVTGARAHLNLFEKPEPAELAAAKTIAGRLHLEPLLEKTFGVMSTGERQQILIGRALMPEPRVVILDEPCAGLDLAGRERLLQLIERIGKPAKGANTGTARGRGPSVLFTTHHLEEISGMFTHALLLKQGRVFARGAIGDVMNSKTLSEQFEMNLRVRRMGRRWTASAVNPSLRD